MNKIVSGVCLLLVLSSAAWAQPGQVGPGVVAAGEKIAIRFIESHIYLPVTVAGKERLWILDCGAGGSVIDKGFAQELGLDMSGEVEAVGAAGSVRTGFVTVPGLRVGSIELDSQPMVVLEIAELMRRNTGTEPAGILGYDFISRFVTKVDFAGNEVTFYLPESFSYQGPGREVSMRLAANIPAVEVEVAGVPQGWWRLDLGASVATLHRHAVEQYGLADRAGVDRMAGGVGGLQRMRLVRFEHATLAGFRVEGPIISVPLEGDRGALAATEVVGTLGNSVLRNFTLYLDYRNNRAIFERGGNFGSELVLDRSGLQVSLTDDGGFTVVCAALNTPAEKAGFKAGDTIEAVDGRSPEALGGIGRLREMLRAAPGTRYRFAVRRGDASLSLNLVLANLL
jgi:hypothetical protein